MKLDSYYFGMIVEVYPPTSQENASKYQYEYQVLITADDYAQIPVRCIRKDSFGTGDDFEDLILPMAAKVMVRFPRGDRSCGVIESGTRAYAAPQDVSLGRHYRKRFNKLVEMIDKTGNWSIVSDSGPNLHVNTDKIILDDSAGQKVTFDKAAKVLTIEGNELNIKITGNATMTVGGNLTADVKGKVSIKAGGDANVEATGKAIVKAKEISLNGSGGDILTTLTDPVVDTIFGIPTQGVKTVKSG